MLFVFDEIFFFFILQRDIFLWGLFWREREKNENFVEICQMDCEKLLSLLRVWFEFNVLNSTITFFFYLVGCQLQEIEMFNLLYFIFIGQQENVPFEIKISSVDYSKAFKSLVSFRNMYCISGTILQVV